MTVDPIGDSSPRSRGASAVFLLLEDRIDSRLGSVVIEASSTLATPSVSSSPMLKIPR